MKKPSSVQDSDGWACGDEQAPPPSERRGPSRREAVYSGIALLALALVFVALRGWQQGWAQPTAEATPVVKPRFYNSSAPPMVPAAHAPSGQQKPAPQGFGGIGPGGFGSGTPGSFGGGGPGGFGTGGGGFPPDDWRGMGPGMMGSGMAGPGMVPPTGQESASRQALRARVAPLVQQLRKADDDEAKQEITQKISDLLEEYFDRDMDQRRSELKTLQQRLERLQEQCDRRQEAKQDILSLQLKVLENEASGLGFFGGAAAPGDMYSPYGGFMPGGSPYGAGGVPGDHEPAAAEGAGEDSPQASLPWQPGAGGTVRPRSGFAELEAAHAVTTSQIALKAARNKLERLRAAHQQGALSATEFQEAEAAVELAQQNLAQARRDYDAQDQLLDIQFRQAQVLLQLVEAELAESLAINRRSRNTIPDTQLKRQEAKVQEAKLALERAQLLLDLHRQAGQPAAEPASDVQEEQPRNSADAQD